MKSCEISLNPKVNCVQLCSASEDYHFKDSDNSRLKSQSSLIRIPTYSLSNYHVALPFTTKNWRDNQHSQNKVSLDK